MRTFWNSSALALSLAFGLACGAQAGQADKAAANPAATGASAGASSKADASAKSGGLAAMAPQELLGKKVVSGKGKQLGQIAEVLEGEDGERYALVDLPGDTTPPAKSLMPLDELKLKGGQVTWLSERAEGELETFAEADRSKYKSLAAALTQEELNASLEQAGFQNVATLDAAYLVRATASDGSPVYMMIDPPSSGAAAGASAGASKDASPQATSKRDALTAALKKAGFRDVAVLDAAYFMKAEAADGTPITMMIDAHAPRTAMSGSAQSTSGKASKGGKASSGGTSR